MPPKQAYVGPWKHRRRIIYATLIYCGGMVAYLSIFAEPSTLREQVVIALIGLAFTTIGTYVGGAVWDDISIRRNGGGQQQ